MKGLAYAYICVVPRKSDYSYSSKGGVAVINAGFGTLLISNTPFDVHSGMESQAAAKLAVKASHYGPGIQITDQGTSPYEEYVAASIGPLLDMISLKIVEAE